jgi:hypothetical protein
VDKHSEDPETIIHEGIAVIVIKLNYVKQLQDLKKNSAWNIYKKPCSMRNSPKTQITVENSQQKKMIVIKLN